MCANATPALTAVRQGKAQAAFLLNPRARSNAGIAYEAKSAPEIDGFLIQGFVGLTMMRWE